MNRKNIVIRAAAVFMAFLLLMTSRDFLSSISAVEPEEQTGVHTHAEGCTVECTGEDCTHVCDEECRKRLEDTNNIVENNKEDKKNVADQNNKDFKEEDTEGIAKKDAKITEEKPYVVKENISNKQNESGAKDVTADINTLNDKNGREVDRKAGYEVPDNIKIFNDGISMFSAKEGTIYNTDYAYQQLNATEKNLYNQLVNYYGKFHNSLYNAYDNHGSYIISDDLQGTTPVVLDLRSNDLTYGTVEKVFNYFRYDNPQYFSMFVNLAVTKQDDLKTFITNELPDYQNLKVGHLYGLIKDKYATASQRATFKFNIENAVSSYLRPVENATDYNKVKYIYEKMISETNISTTSTANNMDIDAVFLDKSASFIGAGKAFQMILNYAQIDNVIVQGLLRQSGGDASYLWNIVKLNGNYYNIDLLFGYNQDLRTNKFGPGNCKYFCFSDQDMPNYLKANALYTVPECTNSELTYSTLTASKAQSSDVQSNDTIKAFINNAVIKAIELDQKYEQKYFVQLSGNTVMEYIQLNKYLFTQNGEAYTKKSDIFQEIADAINNKLGTSIAHGDIGAFLLGDVICINFDYQTNLTPDISISVKDGSDADITEASVGDTIHYLVSFIHPINDTEIMIGNGDMTTEVGGTAIDSSNISYDNGVYDISYTIPEGASSTLTFKVKLRETANYKATEKSKDITVNSSTVDPPPGASVVKVTPSGGSSKEYTSWSDMLNELTDNSEIELLSDITLPADGNLPDKICTIKNTGENTYTITTEGESLQLKKDLTLEKISITKPIYNNGKKLTLNGSVNLASVYENLGELIINNIGNVIQAMNKDSNADPDTTPDPSSDLTLKDGASLTVSGKLITSDLKLGASAELALTDNNSATVHSVSGELSGTGILKLNGNSNGISVTGSVSQAAAIHMSITDVLNLDNYAKKVMLFAPDAGISAERFICENTGYEFKVVNNGLYLLKDTYNTPTVSAKVRNEDTLSAYTGDFRQEVFFEFECSGFNSEIMKYQVSSDNGTNWSELSEITAESDALKGKLYYDVQGEHDLNFRLVTKAGDELSTATTEAIKVKIDKVSPAFTVAATADGADYTYDADNAVDSDVLFTFTQTAAEGIPSGVTYYYATSNIEADAATGWTAITNNTFTATAESGLTNTNTYYFKAVSGSGKVVKADSSWQVNIDKTGPQPGTPIVAIEGGADYETWADMLAALQDGDVIILKQNVKLSDLNLPNKSCTIKNTEGNTYKINTDSENLTLNNDLILENISFIKPVYNNGHNLTLNGSVSLSALYENVGTLTVNGADNKILALDEDAGVNAETTPDPSMNFTLADQASLSVGGSLLCKALNLGSLSELIMTDNIGENAHVVHGELSGTGTIKLNGNCGGISLTGSVSDAANIHVNITDIENLDNYSSKVMSFGAELGVSAERFACDNTGYQFKIISNSLYLLKNSYNAPAASAKVRSGDTLSAYTAGSYAQAVYFEFTCAGFNSDIMKYQVSSNGGTDWSDLSEITAEDDVLKGSQYYDVQGDHNLTFRLATKGGEALSDSSAETSVKIDKTVPTFTVAATANGAEYTYDADTATEEDVLFTFTLTAEGGVPSDVTYYYATSNIAADAQSGWTVIDGNTFTATARSGKTNTNTYYFKAVSGSGVANKDASSHSVNIQKPADPDNPFVPVVAIKDGNEFETWEDMLAELNDGDTIVLMDDIVLDEGKLPAGSHKIVSDVNEAGTPYAVSTKNSVPINMQGDLNISKVSINAGLLNKGFKLTLSGDSYVDELFMKSGENAAVFSEGDGNEIGSLDSETTGEYLDVEVNAAGGSGSLKIPYNFTSKNVKVGQGAVLMLTGDGTSVKKAEGALSGTGTIELNAAGPSLSVKGGLAAGSGLTIKVSDNKVTDLTHEVISFITDPSVSISASSFVSAHNGYALVMRESKLWFMEDLSAKAAPVVTAHVKAGENMAAYDNSYKKDIYLKFASGDFKSDTMVYQYKENAADAQWTTAVIPTSAADGEVGYLHMTQEGEKSYVFRMASADGTNATPATGSALTLKIDRTAPAAPSITNAGSYTDWFNANQTVTATFTQSSGSTEALHYSVDGGNTYTAGSSYTTSADGSTTVAFKLVDEAGNESTPVSVTVKVDSIIPEFTTAAKVGNENYTYNENSPVESDVTFSFTNQPVNKSGVTYYYATSDLDVSASSGWTQITGSTFNATANSGASNKNTYYFKAVSGAGLVKKSAAYKVNIEKPNFSAISVSTGSYRPGDWSKSDVTFQLSGGLPAALFDHYEVAATASNAAAAPQDGWTAVNGADGTSHKVDSDGQNKYWFRAASTGGAKGSVTSGHIVKLDKTRPVIQSAAFSQIDGETTGSITVKASDGNSGSGISKVQLAVDTVVVATQTGTDSNGNYVFDGLANGTYLVIVTDNAGNQDDGSHSVIVKLNILNSIQIQGGTDGLITLQMDQSLTKNVTAVLDPADYVGTLNWESQNTKVAQVASDGAGGAVITAKGEGFTVIKVSSANKSDTVYVKVKPKDETETGVSHNTASEITNLCKEIKDTTPKAIIMEIADEITRLPEKEQAKLSKSTLSKIEGLYEDVLEDSSFSIKVEPDEGFTPADEVAMKDADIAACGGLIAAAAGGEAPEGKNVELRISQLEPTNEKAILEYSCKLYVGEEEKPLSSPLYLTIKLPASADTKNLIIRHFKDNGEEEVIKPSEVKNGLMTYLTTSFSSFQVINDETAAQDPTDPGTSDPTTGDGTDGNKNGTTGGDTGTDGNGSGDGTTDTGNGTSGGQSGTGGSSQSGSNAKTGDSTNALPFIFLAAGSLAALAYALQKRKRA